MKYAIGEVFRFVFDFIAKNGERVVIPMEMIYTGQAWKFGDTMLWKVQKANDTESTHLKTTEELRKGIMSDDNAVDPEVMDLEK